MKVSLIEHMGSDLHVVNAARVSFGKKSGWEVDYVNESIGLSDKDKKLVNYLAKHKHLSPFGHCFATFHIKAPVFVRAQLVKHEYLRMNEISRRYVDSTPEFYVPDAWRAKAVDKKQGSGEDLEDRFTAGYKKVVEECLIHYDHLIDSGVAPEQARMVLPQSMMTEWYWSGSLDAFANMVNLRSKPDAQYETRLISDQISDMMSNIYPVSWNALCGTTETKPKQKGKWSWLIPSTTK